MTRPPTSPGVYASLDELVAFQRRVNGFSFLPRQPVNSILAGRHASRLRGRGLNFEEIRRYQPGDDVRQIDWKVTVRTRKTHTRVYTEERERSVLLVVDQRRSMFFGSVKNMKSVTAAHVAAAAAWRVLAQKDRAGAVVFDDVKTDVIRPRRSRSNVMQILQSVLTKNQALSVSDTAPTGAGLLNTALAQVAQLAKHDVLVVLISDLSGHDEETNQLLTRIARHNDVLVLFVHDPFEKELPEAGRLIFSNGTQQLEIDTGDDGLRRDFQATFAQKLKTGQTFLLQRETPLVPLSTGEDVLLQLQRHLGRTHR